jgi:5,10-methylenetetrahydrofolate reductase
LREFRMLDPKRQAGLEKIWEHIARLGITEQDVADAVAWARANPGAKDVDIEVSALLRRYQKVPPK